MRILELASHFDIPVFVCVNKWDINPEITELIEKTSLEKGADVIGRISWDSGVTRAQIEGKSAVEMEDSIAVKEISEIWKKLKQMIK